MEDSLIEVQLEARFRVQKHEGGGKRGDDKKIICENCYRSEDSETSEINMLGIRNTLNGIIFW